MPKQETFIKQNSLRRQWVYTYIFILLIPIIIVVVVYIVNGINLKIDRERTIVSNAKALENLQGYLDEQLDELISSYYDIIRNTSLTKVVDSQNSESEFRQTAAVLLRELQELKEAKEISYVIYFPKSDYVIWNRSGYSSEIMYNIKKISESSGLDYEEWVQHMADFYELEFIETGVYSEESHGESIVYANTIKKRRQDSANIFISIYKSEIEELIEACEVDNHIVVAKEDKILFSTLNELSELVADEAWWDIKSNDIDGFTVLSKMSKREKIKYFLLVPEETYERRKAANGMMLFGGLIMILLSGVVGTYLLLTKNFKKIEAVLSKFGINEKKANEFEQIESLLENLYYDNCTMKNDLQEQENQIFEKNLLAIMQKKYLDIEPITSLLSKYQVYEKILLVALEFNKFDKVGRSKALSWKAVDCSFGELMKGEQFYRTEDDRHLLYLFVFSGNEDYKAEITSKVNFLCDFAKEKLEVEIVAAISRIDDKVEHISTIYDATMEAFEYGRLTGIDGVIDCDKIPNSTSAWKVAFDVGEQLKNAFNNNSYGIAQECLNRTFKELEDVSLPIAKAVVLHMYHSVLEFLFEGESTEVQKIYMIECLNPLLEADSIRSMEEVLEVVLKKVYKLIDQQVDSEIVKKIQQYIDENYSDGTLNISSIAEALGQNSRMVSKAFRNETGEGILDYLNRVRIGWAIQLLNEKNYSLETIGEMVGYTSYKSFRRTFLKITGTTPGKYTGFYKENIDS